MEGAGWGGDVVQQSLAVWMSQQKAGNATSPGYHYDMLHDRERNAKYREAIQRAVQPDDFVLDIGTGSGLLAMLAARHTEAQHVFACEADPTLARVAQAVVEDNGLDGRVTVVHKFSHELVVGYGDDVPVPVDVVVMEIFDSMLLGECVLPTMHDARRRLMAPGARVVPARATLHAALVASPWLWRHDQLDRTRAPFAPPADEREGSTSGPSPAARPRTGEPIQVFADQCAGRLRLVSEPFECFAFDFADPALEAERALRVRALEDGEAHAVLMWWTLDMDGEGEVLLSTAPHLLEDPAWGASHGPDRDHWRQAAAIFQQPLRVRAGEDVELLAGHTRDMPWFCPVAGPDAGRGRQDGKKQRDSESSSDFRRHSAWQYPRLPRLRMLQLNDDGRAAMLCRAASGLAPGPTAAADPHRHLWVVLGDSSLAVAAVLRAREPAHGVVVAHTSLIAMERTRALLNELGASDGVQLHCTEVEGAGRLDVDGPRLVQQVRGGLAALKLTGAELCAQEQTVSVLAEPFYHFWALPAARSWGLAEAIRLHAEITPLLQADLAVSGRASVGVCSVAVRAVAIECEELWRRRGPLDTVEGLSLAAYNTEAPRSSSSSSSSSSSDGGLAVMELQPWAGAWRAVTAPWDVLTIDMADADSIGPGITRRTTARALPSVARGDGEGPGVCHGVVLWTVQDYGHGVAVSAHPAEASGVRQALWLCDAPVALPPDWGDSTSVTATVTFATGAGEGAHSVSPDALRAAFSFSVGQ